MFVKVKLDLINTDHIIRAHFNGQTLEVTLHEGGNDGSIGYIRYFDGDDAKALWEYLTSPAHCTDVLADVPAPVRP